MFKYFVLFFKIGIYFIFAYPKLLIYSLLKNHISYERRYKFSLRILKMLSWGFGCKYEIKGLENVPEGNNLVFCPNHQAVLDPLIVTLFKDKRFLIIAKQESSKYPYVGRVAKLMDVLFLDREDFRKSLLTMKEASKILSNGDKNMLIFLEGTRSKNENFKMNDFKPGGLKPAFENHSTIIPIAMTGYYRLLTTKNNKLTYKIQIEFLKPITYEDYKDKTTIEVAESMNKLVSERVDELMKSA